MNVFEALLAAGNAVSDLTLCVCFEVVVVLFLGRGGRKMKEGTEAKR